MAHDDEDHEEWVKQLRGHTGWFRVRPVDHSDELWLAHWKQKPTIPTYRVGGVTGTVEVDGESKRVHVCSRYPCTKVHLASKQKKELLPPIHVRLVDWDGGDDGAEPAVVGSSGSAGGPPLPPPPATPALPPQPPTPPAALLLVPASPPPHEPVPADEVDEPSSPPPDMEGDPTLHDKTALAPAPNPAFLPGEGGQDIPPPGRATLLPIPSVVPCELRTPEEAPATVICTKPAVVGQESSDEEAIIVDGELTNPEVAAGMNKFLLSMQGDGQYVGIAAFVVFALKYRVRVHAWFDLLIKDLVALFAPWATSFVTDRPLFDAISCKISEENGLEVHGHELHVMNHWVGSVDDGKRDLVSVDFDASLGEGATEVEETFLATYLSVFQNVVRTIADGDCALDVMCLMLGKPRTLASRQEIRLECCTFARRHVANRAFISMLNQTGEMAVHLGLYELESAGACLMTSPVEAPVVATNHGDGVCVVFEPDPSLLTDRDFTVEELSAMTWKCRMQKSPPELIAQLLQRVPEECILQLVEAFRTRSVGSATKSGTTRRYFLLSRDSFKEHKRKAVQQFLDWTEVTYGKHTPGNIRKLGKMPCFVCSGLCTSSSTTPESMQNDAFR